MNDLEIVIRAFRMEAQQKPNEKIFFGRNGYTFQEFAGMLDHNERLKGEEKKYVESHIQRALKMFKENPTFRQQMMKMAGVEG